MENPLFKELPEQKELKRALVIVNPKSGKKHGPRNIKIIEKILTDGGIEVKFLKTDRRGHATDICRETNLDEIDVLCPVGGDGTVCECLNGFLKRTDDARNRVVIAVIPGGTGNTLAFDLGVRSVEEACQKIVRGKVNRMDVAEAFSPLAPDVRSFSINIVGFGITARVLSIANSKRYLGCGAWYDYAAKYAILKNDQYHARVSWKDDNGETHTSPHTSFAIIQGQITKTMGDKMPFCPTAMLDDGLIDLITIRTSSRSKLIANFKTAKTGEHVNIDIVDYTKCVEYTIEAIESKKLYTHVNIDGEFIPMSPVTVRCLPKYMMVVT